MIRFRDIVIDRSKRTIARNGKTIQFTPYLRQCLLFELACALLLAGPMTTTAYFDLLYDGRDDGGPLSGPELIEVMFCKIAERFSRIDVELVSERPFSYNRRFWAEPMALPKSEAAE